MSSQDFSVKYNDLTLKILKELCAIPAPSGLEDERAKYCLSYLKSIGYDNAYIDEVKNVIWEIKGDTPDYVLHIAHTDTVFPDTKPYPYVDDGNKIYCPGVGDDTVCVALLLAISTYFKEINYRPRTSLLFSANSCEEGLGNLKGSKNIFKFYKDKIKYMITFDGRFFVLINKSVGSKRFLVKVKTEGGHSYGNFGNRNAISVLAKVVNKIYSIKLPVKVNTKTTYNVGTISGGTSVNSIAQTAEMLCEYRSDNQECLDYMGKRFEEIFSNLSNECVQSSIEVVGDRPSMGIVDNKKMDKLVDYCLSVQEKYSGTKTEIISASTDCNIPHSMGIPAVCVGVYDGGGIHAREEYLIKDSVKQGLSIVYDIVTKDILE